MLVKGGEVVAGSSNDESVCAGNFCEREIRFDEQDDEEDDDEGDDEIDDDGEDDNVDADDGVVQDEKTYQQSFNLAFSSRRLGQAIVPVVMSPDVFWSATLIQHHQQQQLLGGIAGQPLEGIQQTVPVVGTPCACYHCVLPVQPEIHVGQVCVMVGRSFWCYHVTVQLRRRARLTWLSCCHGYTFSCLLCKRLNLEIWLYSHQVSVAGFYST